MTHKKANDETAKQIEAVACEVRSLLGKHPAGEVQSAIDRFAIVANAGELATHWNLTGWQNGQATAAALHCLLAWLQFRGGSGNSDEMAACRQVGAFIARYGESRFSPAERGSKRADGSRVQDTHAPRTLDRMGFWEGESKHGETVYHVLKPCMPEICKGYNVRFVLAALRDKGYLIQNRGKKEFASDKEGLPGMNQKEKVYTIRSSVIELADPEPPTSNSDATDTQQIAA